jgi:hypothetical protein
MLFPTVGQTITVNFDVEVEEEDGTLHYIKAGEEFTVAGYDALNGLTPAEYFAEWDSIELIVEAGDVEVQDMWDRSGQSDYTINGGVVYLSLEEDSGLTIV